METEEKAISRSREPVSYIFYHLIILIMTCILYLIFPISHSFAEEAHISADRLEYDSQNNTYTAAGSVKITFGDTSVYADEMYLDSNTYDAVITGNVIYRDTEAVITAERIELNLKTKLGIIYDGYIFYRKNNFHLRSGKIRKIGEKTFLFDRATVTTCNACPPAWHLSGRDITAVQHKSLRGWHGTFNIKNFPVLYTPFFWISLLRERQTGFLFPSWGYSSTRGYYYKQGFFWAIKDNQDATFYVDYHDKKGFGEGIDYRYILSPESNGEIWVYFARDKQPSRSLTEFKAYHNQKFPYNVSGYLKIHNVNEPDYYETMGSTSSGRFGLSSWESTRFGMASEERLQKYLESNLHLSKQYYSGRVYLLAQGRQSLEGNSKEIPQSLPEIGFVLNTRSKKFFSYNAAFKGVNFWKKRGQQGIRLDINPNLFFSYGRVFNITQKVGLRGTAYFLNEPDEYVDRATYDLRTTVTTRLFKRYTSVIHIIEPFLEYTYIPSGDDEEIPFFDSTDSITKTSNITYSLTNKISGLGTSSIETKFKLSQSYSLLDADTDKPFTPLLAEATMTNDRMALSINASYDVDDNILSDLIGSVTLKGKKGFVGVGKSLRRSTDLDQYSFEAGIYSPITILKKTVPLSLQGKLWYDSENGRIQELNVVSSYKKQCWGISLSFNQRPDEYQIIFAVEFTGLGTISIGTL